MLNTPPPFKFQKGNRRRYLNLGAKGQTNQFTYDALNRVLGISYADAKTVSYSYDANGNRAAMADSHGTTAYSHDDLDTKTSR